MISVQWEFGCHTSHKLVPFSCWALAAAEWIPMGPCWMDWRPCGVLMLMLSVCCVSGTPWCVSYSEVAVLPKHVVEMHICVTRCPPPDTEGSLDCGLTSRCPCFQEIFSYSEFHKQQVLTPDLMLEVVRTHSWDWDVGAGAAQGITAMFDVFSLFLEHVNFSSAF